MLQSCGHTSIIQSIGLCHPHMHSRKQYGDLMAAGRRAPLFVEFYNEEQGKSTQSK